MLHPVDSDIDNHSAFAHVIGFYKFRASNRRDNDVGGASNLREIAAARMDNRDRGVPVFVFLHEKQGQRFAHDHASANDRDVRAVDVDVAFNQQTLHPKRRTRDKTAGIVEHELCDVPWMKSVHVLARIERAHDGCFIDVLRRRRLNQNAVNARVAIEFFDSPEKLSLCGRLWQLQLKRVQSQLAAHLVFRTHIGARSRIVADENDGKARRNAFFL